MLTEDEWPQKATNHGNNSPPHSVKSFSNHKVKKRDFLPFSMDDEWRLLNNGEDDEDDLNDDMEQDPKYQMEMETKLNQRHYKKDSRYLLDLYTLTFDDDQTLDEIGTCKTRIVSIGDDDFVRSVSPPFPDRSPMRSRSISSGAVFELGPQSLNVQPTHLRPKFLKISKSGSIPSLETNLLKILARKIQDSEEISLRKVKLLTKAYYRMLRTGYEAGLPCSSLLPTQFSSFASVSERKMISVKSRPHSQSRLSWQKLVHSNPTDLSRMLSGLENTVKVLNDYLVDILLEKDELVSKQDEMLEEISELADYLLQFDKERNSSET